MHQDTSETMSAGTSSSRLDHPSVGTKDAIESAAVSDTMDSPDDDDIDLRLWCRSTLYQIRQDFSPRTAEFLVSLPRKPAPLRDHSECTTRTCIANSTSDDDYQSSHWGKCSQNCEFQGPNVEQIVEIIQSGGIPLISLLRRTDGTLVINVVRATSESRYFAISHVWSGGLGNPLANTLPKCQLVQLYELGLAFNRHMKRRWFGGFLGARQTESLFWMDTLCIPVSKDSVSISLRARAINTMAQIYAKAQAIIILDHELQQFGFHPSYISTNLGHLICSAWMSRCWTFQEGALAAEWLVQFEDGLYSMDKLQRARPASGESGDSDAGRLITKEIQRFVRRLPRFKSTEGQKTFTKGLYTENILLFRLVWNNLCIRSTTKRDDLISIISIVLGFRPRDVFSQEPDNRLLSIFNAQKILPIALLFRERPMVKKWSDANRWLPTKTEDHPIDDYGGSMWRRSPDENFFVFELSKSGYVDGTNDPISPENLPRFYFSQSTIRITETLILIDPDMQSKTTIRALLSPSLTVPKLNLCVIMGKLRENSILRETSYGALLGVRERTREYVRCCYLCPVKLISTGSLDSSLQSNTVLYREELSADVEYVFEHDFSGASRSLHSRPSFSEDATTMAYSRIVVLPLFLFAFYWIKVYNEIAKRHFPVTAWAFYLVLGIRAIIWGVGVGVSQDHLQQVEFDEWYADLYDQRVQVRSYDFYVHPRPLVFYCVFALGSVSWFALAARERLPDFLVPFCAALAAETTLLPVRWLQEIYSRTPKEINFLRWLATPRESRDSKVYWYYQRYYAKSYFTIQIETLIFAVFAAAQSCSWLSYLMPQRRESTQNASNLTPNSPHSPESPTIGDMRTTPADSNGGSRDANMEPWAIDQPSRFVPSHVSYMFAGKFSSLAQDEEYAPFKYLGEIAFLSYIFLILYWNCAYLISELVWKEESDDPFVQALLLIALVSVPLEAHLFLNRVFLPAKIVGWRRLIYRDVAHISDIRISIHYSPRITQIIIGICCAPIMLRFMPSLTPTPIPHTLSSLAAFELGSLALRWFIELWAQYNLKDRLLLGRTWDRPSILLGNDERDICYSRFYAKSELTISVEAVIAWVWGRITWLWALIRVRRNWLGRVGRRSARRDTPRWARGQGVIADEYADDGDNHFDAEELLVAEYRD